MLVQEWEVRWGTEGKAAARSNEFLPAGELEASTS